MIPSIVEKSPLVSGASFFALLAGIDHCSTGTVHDIFLLRSSTVGGLGFISSVQFSELATGCYLGRFICILHVTYTGMYSALFSFRFINVTFTLLARIREHNIILIMHTDELYTIYVRITSHDQ